MKKKRKIWILIAALLICALGGCSRDEENVKEEEKPVIAYLGSDVGNTGNVILGNSMKALCDLAGCEIVYMPDTTYDADSCISFVESQISAGTKGLILTPPSDSVLLTIMNLCEEAEVYWGITTRSIADDRVRESVESSKFYVGNCYEDEYNVGRNIMDYMHDFGYKKFAIISTAKGNTTCDAREAAISSLCEEYGMEQIAEARDFTQASEITAACQSFLSAYDDLDCILIVGTYATGAPSAAVKAIREAGRGDEVKLIAVDFDMTEGIVDCFESGICTLDIIGTQYDPFVVAAKVLNAVCGTPLSEKGFETELGMAYITDVETAKEWERIYTDDSTKYMTDDEMKRLLVEYTPDLTAESFSDFAAAWDPLGR